MKKIRLATEKVRRNEQRLAAKSNDAQARSVGKNPARAAMEESIQKRQQKLAHRQDGKR